MNHTAPGPVLEFGPFVLLTRERLLLRHGAPVPLAGKAFDLLSLLVSARGELVTRERLVARLWPGVSVGPNSLAVAAAMLRRALGDEGARPAYVASVRGHGYRFVADVLELDGSRHLASSETPGTWKQQSPEHHCLLGRLRWQQRTAEALTSSIADFERAVGVDPSCAAAYVGMADAYMMLGCFGTAVVSPSSVMPKAEKAAEIALRLAPDLPAAVACIGALSAIYRRRLGSAERCLRRAIDLDGSYAPAHQWLSHVLVATGRFGDAIAEIDEARRLDPLSPVITTTTAWVRWFAGDAQAAVSLASQAASLHPTFAPAHAVLGLAQQRLGRLDEAVSSFRTAVTLEPAPAPVSRACLGQALGAIGDVGGARTALALLDVAAVHQWVSPVSRAWVHASLHDLGAAFDCVSRGAGEGDGWALYLHVDPRLDAMRQDPRFEGLARQAGPTED
jgi:DNA-binding winged helix-turn-helix (wHTH) protein